MKTATLIWVRSIAGAGWRMKADRIKETEWVEPRFSEYVLGLGVEVDRLVDETYLDVHRRRAAAAPRFTG